MPRQRKKKVKKKLAENASIPIAASSEREAHSASSPAELGAGEDSRAVVVFGSVPSSVAPPARRRKRSEIVDEEDDGVEVDFGDDDEDDCQVAGDSDCEGVNDADEDEDVGVEQTVNDEDCNEEVGLGVTEDANNNIAKDFAEIVGDEGQSDDDSGDDIWNEDKIPDPLSSDDEDEVEDEQNRRQNPEDPELLIQIEKTYNSPEDFK